MEQSIPSDLSLKVSKDRCLQASETKLISHLIKLQYTGHLNDGAYFTPIQNKIIPYDRKLFFSSTKKN